MGSGQGCRVRGERLGGGMWQSATFSLLPSTYSRQRFVLRPIQAAQHPRLDLAVAPAALRAEHDAVGVGVGKPVAVAAHPAAASRRHADHQRVVGHIAAHHRAPGDERVAAEGRAAHDGRVRADGRAAAHHRPQILAVADDLRAGVDDVGEHARRPAEDVVLQIDGVIHRDVVLDLDVAADARGGADKNICPRLQRSPMTAPLVTWQKCQMRVPAPISHGSST